MKIHEYQAKEILKKYGVEVPQGEVAYSPLEVRDIAKRIGGRCVIKAQIHAGGRGKGGGIRIASNSEEAGEIAKQMIGMTLVTHQTGPEGKKVKRVLVEKVQDIEREYYLAVIVDRSMGSPVIMASSEGGVEIEQVAARSPDKILKEHVDPAVGISPYVARKICFGLGFKKELIMKATKLILSLYEAFVKTDVSLAEINPLITTKDGNILALDAKMNFDDNALYRHPEIKELRDLDEEDPLEIEASKYNLNYIKLSGNVGCMVNGAGLAMATMDIIKLAGGEPANFLDVGGGATKEQVANAFKILISDKNVRAVLVNIFGGIMRCDIVANGVVEAAKEVGIKVPMVVRLEGTNVEKGKETLQSSGLNFIVATGMMDAAEKVVAAAR
ncbi:MAG: ADP-forming succinate--CoA ligase subunit beta [Acidobacteriota bacterium]